MSEHDRVGGFPKFIEAARHQLLAAFKPPGRHLSEDDLKAIEKEFHAGAELTSTYGFMLFAACGIAALGLLQSSVAVVIGAMLISPLMGPILSLGLSLAQVRPRAFKSAAITLAVGVALSILASTLIVWVSPLKDVTPEILARTRPTLLDLVVALLSGFVGAYLSINHKAGAIAGVAIATALMPPLAVVGYGIATGAWSIAGGATLLFLTNVVAILGSVFLVARRYGFRSRQRHRPAWEYAALAAATIALCVPLALSLRTIVVEARETTLVRGVIESTFAGANPHITDLSVETSHGAASDVQCVVVTRKYVADASQRIARALKPGAAVSIEQVVTAGTAPTASALGRRQESVIAANSAPQDRLRAMLGATGQVVSVAVDGRVLRANMTMSPSAELADYRAAEQAAQRFVPESVVQIIPPLTPLPLIRFAAGAASLDAAADAEIADVAWALERWAVSSVSVEGRATPGRRGPSKADARVAERRAQAVAEALASHGVTVQNTTTLVPETAPDDAGDYIAARISPRSTSGGAAPEGTPS